MKTSLQAVLMLTLALTAHAQQAQPADVPGGGQAQAPATLLGQRSPRDLLTEPTPPNYLAGGISISQLYTDNALLTTTDRISDLSYTFTPHLTLVHSGARLSYDLSVLVGFIVNRTLDEQNQSTQTGSLDLSYGLTRHTTFRVSESFMNSTGLWSGASAATSSDSGGGVGAIQAPTSALYTFRRFQSNTALLELSHQFTLRDFGGVRGGISSLWYPDNTTAPGVGALYGGQTYSAEAFYNHQFTLRQWAGVSLRAERFDVNQLSGRTDTLSPLFLYGINLRPTMSLSLFGGPTLSITSAPKGVVVAPSFQSRMWSPYAGAVFNWRHTKTSATATFSHEVSNGGGLASAVTLDSARVDLARQLARPLTVDISFAFNQSVPIVTAQTIRTYSERIQFAYHFRNHFALTAGYDRDDNQYLDSGGTASADRVSVSFSYDFLKSIGRGR